MSNDGNMSREAATAATWRDLLAAVERGDDPIPTGGLIAAAERRSQTSEALAAEVDQR